MQSVPSLIGAGTAVAAAATGLVFGQLAEGEQLDTPHHSSNSGSIRRKLVTDRDFSNTNSFSRPGTSSAASTAPSYAQNQAVLPLRQSAVPVNATSAQARIPRRASHVQVTPTKPPGSRHSVVKQSDLVLAPPIAEDSCDSVSSNGSWMRRLSIRPLSQHGSLRSSIGPDSPSIFSFGSAAPILSSSRDSPSQLPPNKLVKRAPGTALEDTGFHRKRGSRQMTLRRPATSHQRSATLQHQLNAEDLPPLPKFSFDHHRPRARTVGTHQEKPLRSPVGGERSRWKSFWHAKVSNITMKATPLRGIDGSAQSSGRRIRLDQQHSEQAYLVAPNNIIMNGPRDVVNGVLHNSDSPSHTNTRDSPRPSAKEPDSTEVTPSKQPKRSISMQFSSPTNWIARTGSVRRRKRGGETTGSKRHVSAPIADNEDHPQSSKSVTPEKIRKGAPVSQAEADLAAIFRPPDTQRSSPSPIPPLSRLSSFHLGINGHDSSSSVLPDRPDEAIVSPSVSSRVNSHGSHTRTLERASTVGSSEYHRGFTSGDDDDTDFKTDTPFDSFRTVASGRKNGPDSPLESMFDDSPPSTAGNNTKMKRLSIQEILGPSFDGGHKIMEEDESVSTPIRGTYEEFEARFRAASIEDEKIVDGSPDLDFPIDRDYTRLSLDDDDDLEWAREHEAEFYNHLSPPSSMNSRRGSPKIRNALMKLNGNSKPDVHFSSTKERPRSTVFDWTEPPAHGKREKNGYIHRPKTVHGKQELDLRGGRAASRKGFVATHVRSQSVPVVPDPTETAKSAPKFGTWGLGQKNVSEDWDDDFEFEEDAVSITGPPGKKDNQFLMFVPASIQATQPTVKAHSGQIRELSLLVNDLKRLCRLGREMNMLVGSFAKLWHEAEGIIALASPDEDTEAMEARTADGYDSVSIDERFIDQGFDGASLEVREGSQHRGSPSSRRRSVFSPDDDIFGTWDNINEESIERPKTPQNPIVEPRSTSVARSVMESMRKHRATFDIKVDDDDDDDDDNINEHSNGKMNFDTNSLKELVKRAGDLRDSLSELVRREDHLTQSPIRTPKRTRPDGSPAFTRVFDEPTSSPTRRISHNHNNKPVNGTPVATSPSNGISRRMQMMIVR